MKELIEKIIEKIGTMAEKAERKEMEARHFVSEKMYEGERIAFGDAIEIVKQTEEEYNNGWIPCSEMLPKVEINPVTNDYVRYNVTYNDGNVSDVRCYAYGEASGGKHWMNGGKIMDEYVIAWQPLPEPYQPKGE